MWGSRGISVSRRDLPAVITSNNSFSLGDKSPFLGADMLVVKSSQLGLNRTEKTRSSGLKGGFLWYERGASCHLECTTADTVAGVDQITEKNQHTLVLQIQADFFLD